MKYRKKPVVIEAHQVTVFNLESVAEWCGGQVVRGTADAKHRLIAIRTLEGVMEAAVGDYVIRGIKGEFYPCKPDIFEATYEEAE
jgi:hypothetical protein